MSAVEEGLSSVDAWRARRAMDLEAGVSHTGQTTLQGRIGSPMNEFDAFQQQMVDSRGGSRTIENVKDELAKQGIQEIEQLRSMPKQQQDIVGQSEEFLRNRLRNDPLVGSEVTRMEGNIGLDTGAAKSRAEDVVMGDLRQTVDTMKDVSRKLYDEIPEGEPIDVDSFDGVIRNAQQYLPKQVLDTLSDEGTILDFKFVHNEILPSISKRITQLQKQASPDQNAIDALEEVRHNITQTQVDFLEQNGSDTAKQYSKMARDYYREDIVPFSKTSSTKELFDTKGKTKYDLERDAQEAVNSLTDKNKGGSRAVLDLLSRPENQGNPDAIFSVYLGDVSKKWGRKLADSDGIDKLDPSDILSELDDVGVTFKERFPAQVKQVEKLANDLRAAKGDVKLQKETLRNYEIQARELENEVYAGALGNFIEKGIGGNITKRQDAYNIFKGLLHKETSGPEIDEIVKRVRASGDPVAQKGLESAYISYIRDVMTPKETTGLNARLASRLVDKDQIKMLKGYGKKIFQNPDVIDSYDAIVSALLKERDKRSPAGLPLQTKGGLFKSATFAANFLINSTLGVLNPTATKVRNITGAALRSAEGDKAALELMERIHADPDYALGLLKKLENSATSGLSKDGKNIMWRIGVMTGLYAGGEDKKRFEKDWDDYTRKEKLRSEMDNITKRNDKRDREDFEASGR
jgi:hypothetical protein